jgi:hypothetical protein
MPRRNGGRPGPSPRDAGKGVALSRLDRKLAEIAAARPDGEPVTPVDGQGIVHSHKRPQGSRDHG